MNRNIIVRSAVTAGLILMTAASCVYIDEGLGSDFIPENRRYTVSTAVFPLKKVKLGLADSLSGYSSDRITVGEIQDEDGNWEVYGSAFTLVPVNSSIDFGKNIENIRFHFTAVRDTFSVCDANQMHIPQNIYIYELQEALDKNYTYIGGTEPVIKEGQGYIGYTTYNGGDSLSFNFNRTFAETVINTIKQAQEDEIYDDIEEFTSTGRLPGIYITPQPVSDEHGLKKPGISGGRINMFELTIKISDSYYVTGNYAELAFTADYGEREKVDTSFLFYFGPQERKSSTTQYALNISRNSSIEKYRAENSGFRDKVSWDWNSNSNKDFIVEGGAGLKPVISAAEIKMLITKELAGKGIDPNTVIINKATISLPYQWETEDFDKSYLVPQMLNPTSRIKGTATDEDGNTTSYVTYAGLTDASIDTENQGDVDRSRKRYAPDVSHHVQTILKLKADADLALSGSAGSEEEAGKFEDYDIWMLVMADETITTNQDNSAYNDYYQNLAYANYYNSMYDPYGYGYGGYGYGGYGYGYGSYGYGYNNYYSYLAMAQMASSSGSTTSTVTQLDKDRYYRCRLVNPTDKESLSKEETDSVPHLTVIYSYIRNDEE